MINCWMGYDNKPKQIDRIYAGVNNKARLCTKGYVGVNGVARQIYPRWIPVPSVSGSFYYTGETQSAILENANEKVMTISGEPTSKNVGVHTVNFDLKPPFTKWMDGTTGRKTGTWQINGNIEITVNKTENSWAEGSCYVSILYGRVTYNGVSAPPNVTVSFIDSGTERAANDDGIYDDDQYWISSYNATTGDHSFNIRTYRYGFTRNIQVKVVDHSDNDKTYYSDRISLYVKDAYSGGGGDDIIIDG